MIADFAIICANLIPDIYINNILYLPYVLSAEITIYRMLSPCPVLSGISCMDLPCKCLETPSMADMGYLATTALVTPGKIRIPSLPCQAGSGD